MAVNEGRRSRTALATSLMRARHTRLDRPTLIEDPWGDLLVPESDRDAIRKTAAGRLDPDDRKRLDALRSPQAVLDAGLRANPAYGTVIVRTRCAEDSLEAAVARGVRQYVIIGAGMDSFALRRPPFARGVQVFEVDHPATQEFKRRRLEECRVSPSRTLHFVPADLTREQLDRALARSPYSRARPAFFAWLGVSEYLTREVNVATLRAIAACAAAGSELVFSYLDRRVFDRARRSASFQKVLSGLASIGEPWFAGFDPVRLAEDLRGVG